MMNLLKNLLLFWSLLVVTEGYAMKSDDAPETPYESVKRMRNMQTSRLSYFETWLDLLNSKALSVDEKIVIIRHTNLFPIDAIVEFRTSSFGDTDPKEMAVKIVTEEVYRYYILRKYLQNLATYALSLCDTSERFADLIEMIKRELHMSSCMIANDFNQWKDSGVLIPQYLAQETALTGLAFNFLRGKADPDHIPLEFLEHSAKEISDNLARGTTESHLADMTVFDSMAIQVLKDKDVPVKNSILEKLNRYAAKAEVIKDFPALTRPGLFAEYAIRLILIIDRYNGPIDDVKKFEKEVIAAVHETRKIEVNIENPSLLAKPRVFPKNEKQATTKKVLKKKQSRPKKPPVPAAFVSPKNLPVAASLPLKATPEPTPLTSDEARNVKGFEDIEEKSEVDVDFSFIHGYKKTPYEEYVARGGSNRKFMESLRKEHEESFKARSCASVSEKIFNELEVEFLRNIIFGAKSQWKGYSWNRVIGLLRKAGWTIENGTGTSVHFIPRAGLHPHLGSHGISIHAPHRRDGIMPEYCVQFLKLAFKKSYRVRHAMLETKKTS